MEEEDIKKETQNIQTPNDKVVDVDELLDALFHTLNGWELYMNMYRETHCQKPVRGHYDVEAIGFKNMLNIYNKYCDPLKLI